MVDLIKSATERLENSEYFASSVDNTINNPMVIFSNYTESTVLYEILRKNLKRIWPNGIKKVLWKRYDTNSSDMSFYNFDSDEKITEQDIQIEYDKSREKSTFKDMNSLKIYNIIDTSKMSSHEEFVTAYETLKEKVEELYPFVVKEDMVIVLLDESLSSKVDSQKIRSYIVENRKYSSIFVLSNRFLNGGGCKMESLYDSSSKLVALSNNISKDSVKSYKERINCFYDSNIKTISHVTVKRPNHEIAVQMVSVYANYLKDEREKFSHMDRVNYSDILNIDGILSKCSEELRRVSGGYNISIFDHIAFKNKEFAKNVDFNTVTYRDLKNMIFDDVFTKLVDNSFKRALPENEENRLIELFKDMVASQAPCWVLASLDDSDIDYLFEDYTSTFSENVDLRLPKYIEEFVRNNIEKGVMYVKYKEAFKELVKSAKQTELDLFSFINELSEIEVDDNIQLGTLYQNKAELYLTSTRQDNTIVGEKFAIEISRPGNNYDDFRRAFLSLFMDNVNEYKGIFNLKFAEEWEQRLRLAGADVFNNIHEAIDSSRDNTLRLSNIFSKNLTKQIYCFHTNNDNGLCDYVKGANQGNDEIEYFNTGLEDSIEVIKIFDCKNEI